MKLINDLKDLLSQTTAAPWNCTLQSNAFHSVYGNTSGSMADAELIAHNMKNEVDGEFIAQARNAMPLLIRSAECLRDILQGYENGKGGTTSKNFDNALKILEELGDDYIKITVNPVFIDDNGEFKFGLEIYSGNDDEDPIPDHVEWFKNIVFRDLAIKNLQEDPTFVIPKHWNDIRNIKVAVFNDPMTGTAWFMDGKNVFGAPVDASSGNFCPAEVFSPDALSQYHIDFIEKLLGDYEAHTNYEANTFYYVFLDELKFSLNESLTNYLQSTEHYEVSDLTF